MPIQPLTLGEQAAESATRRMMRELRERLDRETAEVFRRSLETPAAPPTMPDPVPAPPDEAPRIRFSRPAWAFDAPTETFRNGALSSELYQSMLRQSDFSRYLDPGTPTGAGPSVYPSPPVEQPCTDENCMGECMNQQPEGLFTCTMLQPFGIQDNGRYPGWQRKAQLDMVPLPYREQYRVAVIGVSKLPPGGKALVAQALNSLRLNYAPIQFRTGACQGTDQVVREFCTGYQIPFRQYGTGNPPGCEEFYSSATYPIIRGVQLVLGFRVENDALPLTRGYITLRRRARTANIPFQEYVLPCDASTTIAPA